MLHFLIFGPRKSESVFNVTLSCLQTVCQDNPIEVTAPGEEEEEELKVNFVLTPCSRDDYYGGLSDACRDSYSSGTAMDSLKVNLHFPDCTQSIWSTTSCLLFYKLAT